MVQIEFINSDDRGGHPLSFSIDRIDSSKGYIKSNIVLTSGIFNYFKSDFTLDELYCLSKGFIDYYQNKLNDIIDVGIAQNI